MINQSTIIIPTKYWLAINPSQVKYFEEFKKNNPPEKSDFLVKAFPWINDLIDQQRVDTSDITEYWDHASDTHTHPKNIDLLSLYDWEYYKHVREYEHIRDSSDWLISLSQTIQGILDPDATFKLRVKYVVIPASSDKRVNKEVVHYWILSLEATTSEYNAILVKLSM